MLITRYINNYNNNFFTYILSFNRQYSVKLSSHYKTPLHSKNVQVGVKYFSLDSLETHKYSMERTKHNFKFSDYDCLGFDMDNTLCEYNIKQMVELEYITMVNYLCKEKSYNIKYFKPLCGSDFDFLQRGLILDLKKGNIIKLNDKGVILKASHGSRIMTEEEIINVYGADKQWKLSNAFCKDMISTWNGPASEELRSLLDFFDITASLVFAKAVDAVDSESKTSVSKYDVGDHILSALKHLYNRGHFKSEQSEYFKLLKANPEKYFNKCDHSVIKWLKDIKKTKCTFLLTGSNVDYASFTANYCLGEQWQELFDVIVCFSRKPGFFTQHNPFLYIDADGNEQHELCVTDIKRGQIVSQGNWADLSKFISKCTQIDNPKCLYFGDNLLQDIYTPSRFTLCDTIAVVEEMSAEGMVNNESVMAHQSQDCLSSRRWGSYFHCEESNEYTYWGSVINKHSKMCIPTVRVLAKLPLETYFNSMLGYYPACPLSLKQFCTPIV